MIIFRIPQDNKHLLQVLALAIGVMFLTYTGLIWWWHSKQEEELLGSLNAQLLIAIKHASVDSREVIQIVIPPLLNDESLQEKMRMRDRDGLLRSTADTFSQLKSKAGITHLYFHAPDLHNFLRVHQPQRYGDLIDRYTLRQAEKTGRESFGMEIGPLGTLTMRDVVPWRVKGELIGYIEAGMEIDRGLAYLSEQSGTDAYVLLDKRYLNRTAWEESMRQKKLDPDWDGMPQYVLASSTHGSVRDKLKQILADEKYYAAGKALPVRNSRYLLTFLSLDDVSGKRVGKLIMLHDVTTSYATANFIKMLLLFTGLAVACLVLFVTYYYLVQQENKLELTKQERDGFHDMSIRDAMTGLYNQKHFYRELSTALANAAKTGQPISVLMMDIDFFKRINDEHGHRAGDDVLRKIAKQILVNARSRDIVARYGGEEFAVILPGLAPDEVRVVAERLRTSAAYQSVAFAGETEFTVTLSAGLATYPQDGSLPGDLVGAADKALYEAKENGRNQMRVYHSKVPGLDSQNGKNG